MPGCFFFFLLVMPVSHSNRGVAYVKGDVIILVIIWWNDEWWNENASLNLTFDCVCNACISTSVFILREKLEPSCARFHALYKHFDFVFSKSTLKGLGLGNHYSASQKMKWNVTNCYIFTRRGRQRQHILSRSMWAGLSFYLKDYIPIPLINKHFDLKTRRTVLDRISPISLTGVCIFNNTLRTKPIRCEKHERLHHYRL